MATSQTIKDRLKEIETKLNESVPLVRGMIEACDLFKKNDTKQRLLSSLDRGESTFRSAVEHIANETACSDCLEHLLNSVEKEIDTFIDILDEDRTEE